MKILALDIAQNVGWAAGDGTPAGTVYDTRAFHQVAHDYGLLSGAFSFWLADMLTEHEPELVAIERGFFRGPMSYHLAGMIWDAHRVAYYRDIPRVEYAPMAVKKSIAGSGRANKQTVIVRVREEGFEPRTDHEADAIALLLLAKDHAATKEPA